MATPINGMFSVVMNIRQWCRWRDLNPHERGSLPPQDSVSAGSTTSAYGADAKKPFGNSQLRISKLIISVFKKSVKANLTMIRVSTPK